MRIGKLPENTWKRSVLRTVQNSSTSPEAGDAVRYRRQYMTTADAVRGNELVISSPETAEGIFDGFEKCALQTAANDLAAAGAEASSFILSFLLPEAMGEPEFREIMGRASAEAEHIRAGLEEVSVETMYGVRWPVLTAAAIGEISADTHLPAQREERRIHPGMDLIVTGSVALEAVSILTAAKRQELAGRFSESFLDSAEKAGENILVTDVSGTVRKTETVDTVMYSLSEGGILRALWEICESASVGMDADVRKIPIRQETIEICEYFGINPYEARSGGSMLIMTQETDQIMESLKKAGIEAVLIGRTTDGNARILRNEEEIRYLDRPAADPLFSILNRDQV